jgi:hypothetical protein
VVGKPVIDQVKLAKPGVVFVTVKVDEAPAATQAEAADEVKLILGFDRTQI